MNTIDLIIFIAYCLLILSVGLFVSRGKKGDERDAGDYFLAGRGLAWWAIGASIIASNISAEQFVGMSGSGYAIGLAMATYEWIAALGLILVAKFFIPIFLEKKIFTMPQFLEERFDKRVKTVMAVFWLAVFIFINLTSILYLGALTIEKVMGIPMLYGIIGLAAFAGIYSIYGGLKVVALTDVVQVVFLVGGGLVTTYIALDLLGEGGGVYQGMVNLYGEASDKFHLILDKSHPGYKDLPGISVILGGLWVANLYYWGCNQYIIQRALAAKSVWEAQNGMLFSGFIKLFIPLLVVIPGIAALCVGGSVREIGRSLPVVARQPPSGRGEGGGVCCFDSRNRQFARFDDEQYLHDLYDGYLPFLFPERGRTERTGPYRTLGELRLVANSRADRPDAVGVGPGVPVYPGVYRLCQSRRPVDLPGRLLL